MSRRRRPRRTVKPAATESLVTKNDGNWWVRPISGASSTKTYRCPGCQQSIAPATPHVVCGPKWRPCSAPKPLMSVATGTVRAGPAKN